MKKLICILALALCAALLCSVGSFAAAERAETAEEAAQALFDLGLFKGKGTDEAGAPIFALGDVPNRAEGITMLVRLLGREEAAQAGDWAIPFTDVADWAKPYVGYAWANGLTKGVSDTEFGSTAPVSAAQYLTFVLRALGYDDAAGDFSWDASAAFADEIGLTHGEYAQGGDFLRSDIAVISYDALSAELKGGGETLLEAIGLSGEPAPAEPEQPAEPKQPDEPAQPTEVVIDPPVEDAFYALVAANPYGKLCSIDGGPIHPTFETPWLSAGVHTLALYTYDGALFTDYYLINGNLMGTIVPFDFWDNGDGTWSFVTDGLTRVLVECICEEHMVTEINEKGEKVQYPWSYKVNFIPQPADADPTPGFSLRHLGCEIEQGVPCRNMYETPWIHEVFYNGQRLDDYSVVCTTPDICDVNRQSDGTLLIRKHKSGMGSFTVFWSGEQADFQVDLS